MDTESERTEWMEAIQSVADKITQQDYKDSSEDSPLVTDVNSIVKSNQKSKTQKVCVSLYM